MESLLILVYFLKEKQNKKKKTLCDSLFGKNMSAKTKSKFKRQVNYREGTVVRRSTPLNLYTYGLY